jgi:hypothetical protein
MRKAVVGVVSAALLGLLAEGASAGPGSGRVQGGGRYVAGASPGYAHGGYRHPVYTGVRHGYYGSGYYGGYYGGYNSGYYGGYWGPSVGIYYGGLGYWGGWPYGWGWGYGYGYPYAYPYGYSSAVVNTTPVPQTYIQQDAAPAQDTPTPSFWYYCNKPAGYYPHVQGCSHPWMKVIPQAPGDSSAPRLAP